MEKLRKHAEKTKFNPLYAEDKLAAKICAMQCDVQGYAAHLLGLALHQKYMGSHFKKGWGWAPWGSKCRMLDSAGRRRAPDCSPRAPRGQELAPRCWEIASTFWEKCSRLSRALAQNSGAWHRLSRALAQDVGCLAPLCWGNPHIVFCIQPWTPSIMVF